MTLTRTLVTTAMTVGLVAAGAGAATAGEITGNGTLKGTNGASECSFSGQNDGYHDGTEAERVQSYGQIVRLHIPGFPNGVPGFACNPSGARLPG